ncbi:MAG: toxin-antitoxin system, antitoxin component [Candidatus Riflebacteria bacterium]|nr:toxin-antitoxin system, antitoxin component [Candidatus Riflebacteria bacterium]
MPQVSLYIDKETLVKIGQLAQKSHTSISKWVGNNLKRLLKDDYPDDYFELFGAIRDTSFARPEELAFGSDTKRMSV